MTTKTLSGPRSAALVGPYTTGKTALLESILFTAGAIQRKGSARDGNTVGDASTEARARQMTTEVNIATTEYLGEAWTFIDCPGSVELAQEAINALMVVDAAVVVCEPDEAKTLILRPLFKFLDDHAIPHVVFVNKMNTQAGSVKGTLDALQAVSDRPLVLREIPIREDDAIVGHVDLVSERAFRWNPHKPSGLIALPDSVKEREREARGQMLESIADFDDALMEKLLDDLTPEVGEIYQSLTKDLQKDLIVPVLFGAAEGDHGVRRLLKLLRHEVPGPAATAARVGVGEGGGAVAQVFKTLHAGHTGKVSLARVWHGEIADGTTIGGQRVSGIFRLLGSKQEKLDKAVAGQVVALGRLEGVATGAVLAADGAPPELAWPTPLTPMLALAIHAEKRADEVKLSGALAKLIEEDPSLSYEANPVTGEMILRGQGEVHLLIALDRLRNRFNLAVASKRPQVAYKETIKRPVSQHARHKKQSGGHGEFGDVHVDIKPLPRGSGFVFDDSITGGAVPKQYIPAVEAGIREYLVRGPLGFPVVDVSVTLTDGQFHTVDSSEMAFKKAGQLAMREGMAKCGPALLEPIHEVVISIPSEFTSKIQRLVSGRRGQILGFDAKAGWKNWDEVKVHIPESEMHGLVVDLRSMTLGVGSYVGRFDHLQEVSGRLADQVVAERATELQQS